MFPPIVVASASPARLALLRAAGVACTSRAPEVDESRITGDSPTQIAIARAIAKAGSVATPGVCVLAADQVAHMDGLSFGKPADPDDHRARLRSLRGRPHTLTTSVVLRNGALENVLTEHTVLHFRPDVSDAEIDAYVATGEGAACAGGYAAEGLGAQLIARIEGDYFNVLGLPLLRVLGSLREMGWRPSFARVKY